jgi:hypothetical protein
MHILRQEGLFVPSLASSTPSLQCRTYYLNLGTYKNRKFYTTQ